MSLKTVHNSRWRRRQTLWVYTRRTRDLPRANRLSSLQVPAHSAIAVEASGNYSWLVDEMERSGHRPRLCNPLEAKRRMGLTKKTDTLDARGLAILLRLRIPRYAGVYGMHQRWHP